MDKKEQRRAAVRALERLRSGLPPDEGAESISVGIERLRPTLNALLRSGDTGEKALLVLGVYGAGKTHTLTLVRDFARADGYATAWLSADSGESSLNHPQRFISALLHTVLYGPEHRSYHELLAAQVHSKDGFASLSELAHTVFGSGAYLDIEIRDTFRRLLWRVIKGNEDPQYMLELEQRLLQLLSGDTIASSAATPNSRAAAYRLLEFAASALRLAGAKGLVIIVDEVESVVTKLHNRLSRRGASRVLAALLRGIDDPAIKLALGMTRDGWELFMESPEVEEPSMCTVHEDVNGLKDYLDELPVFACEQLTSRELGSVLEKVRVLHQSVYGKLGPGRAWEAHKAAIVRRLPGPRTAIRDAVDFLDSYRFYS